MSTSACVCVEGKVLHKTEKGASCSSVEIIAASRITSVLQLKPPQTEPPTGILKGEKNLRQTVAVSGWKNTSDV